MALDPDPEVVNPPDLDALRMLGDVSSSLQAIAENLKQVDKHILLNAKVSRELTKAIAGLIQVYALQQGGELATGTPLNAQNVMKFVQGILREFFQ